MPLETIATRLTLRGDGRDEEMSDVRVIWKGTLATGGRKANEFAAEIVIADGKPHIMRAGPFPQSEVSVYQIDAKYLLDALIAEATTRDLVGLSV